jgi:hypothetical protein
MLFDFSSVVLSADPNGVGALLGFGGYEEEALFFALSSHWRIG